MDAQMGVSTPRSKEAVAFCLSIMTLVYFPLSWGDSHRGVPQPPHGGCWGLAQALTSTLARPRLGARLAPLSPG